MGLVFLWRGLSGWDDAGRLPGTKGRVIPHGFCRARQVMLDAVAGGPGCNAEEE